MVVVQYAPGEGDLQASADKPSWLEQAYQGITTALEVNVWGTPQVAGQVAQTGIDLSMAAGQFLTAPLSLNGNGGGGGNNRFLSYLGLTILGLAAAPAIYRAANRPRKGKRGARDDKIASDLDNASNRATTIISSMAPVLAFPIAYIGIDELENRGVISGKLGDDVQVLMTTMAAASLLGPLGSLIKSVV